MSVTTVSKEIPVEALKLVREWDEAKLSRLVAKAELAPLPAPGEACPHGIVVEESGWLACRDCLTSDHLRAFWPVSFTCHYCGFGRVFFAKDEEEALRLYAEHIMAEHALGHESALDIRLAKFYLEARRG